MSKGERVRRSALEVSFKRKDQFQVGPIGFHEFQRGRLLEL